ncbi:transposase-like protein [[Leptolyngbya] sp. PCC 7376]|uniref:IS630 family transposase n=1 Tax=[Leptolyngbya] sp. PCC 7376 TaxID=111781 RepID=UPI00029F2EFA|nr:IS630 family transposase [[Leptolyngbya] sp. PCC 7376]AFY36557.1 transposase [[Leptolyngbya] sp. PCC 7376]AFY36629.1 transposase [[Leptolyngbya] sp. PCC 7376]AFY36832.1 transposase [[Leptolyngbya] sp. PCC 7376]AFY36842.1 transposase [[Leptolyngbya] sp. PCC 7376]AFY37003.1 transposase [[Leptolyngbya] sp. PCC 7376]
MTGEEESSILPKAYSLDLRQKIVDAYERGGVSQSSLARQFGVAKSFVQKLLDQKRLTGSIAPKKRSQQTPPKLNEEHQTILRQLLTKKNDATLAELCDEMEKRTGLRVANSTMHRTLRRMGYSLKKTFYPDLKATKRVQQARYDFWQKMQATLAKNLIFIDESGVNLAMTRLRARSEKGKRAYSPKSSKRGKNVSLIGALGFKGMVANYHLLGSTDGLTFEAFISQKLIPNLWAGACVVMDNCSIHLGESVRTMIEAVGAKLIYLPPYSPDFSPIENCWSKLKSTLKSIGARTYLALDKAIEVAFSKITLDDIRCWFTHCCYCTSLD